MSVANYEASMCNHAEILICVQAEGNLQKSDLEAALVKIKRHSKLTVADAGRTICFRFELDSSPENSKWGFFQPHRRVMGLIVLAGCSTAMDVALLHEKFQKRKEAFSDFIFDARCFVFGIDNALSHQQSKTEVFQFIDVQSWKLSDNDIKEFLTSVFYVLESKRLQMAADKTDRPPLLTAPFEKNQASTSDSERNFRKKSLGRWKKHLADVSLLSGMKMEALHNYHTALDLLVSANDQVWIGGVLEGLCVTSAIILYGGTTPFPKSPAAKAENKQMLDPRNLVSSKLAGTPSNADLVKLCIQASDDFVDRYKEAVINYSRSEYMGIIELEACIKATKIMAKMNKSMQAAEFLQNAVYIALKVSDEERITKYSVLADLYAEIKFHRKSAFYRRVAAMQCVAPHLDQPDWKKCYTLLKGTFEGYGLDLLTDCGLPLSLSNQQHEFGWPQVRLRVLYELVFSSKRNGGQKIANRYLAYLLMRLHKHMTNAEEKEACATLEGASSKRLDTKKLPGELKLPILHLYNLPTVLNVAPQPLSEELQPVVLNCAQSKPSVFLFTPSSYQSTKKNLNHIDFKWIVNTPSSVRVRIHNPLRVHCMRVTNLTLVCENNEANKKVSMDHRKEPLTIPPQTNLDVTLTAVPREVGSVVITGYDISVFGIQSHCLFRNMPWIPADEYEVDITPEAPLLQKDVMHLTPCVNKNGNSLIVTVFPGESRLFDIRLLNVGGVPVTHADIQTTTPVSKAEGPVFESSSISRKKAKVDWLSVDCGSVDELPIEPRKQLILPLCLKATGSDDGLISNPLSCSCQVKLKYCGAAAMGANLCRVITIDVLATLKLCVNILSISVVCSDRQGWCQVSIEISNVCDTFVDVYSTKLESSSVLSDIETIEEEKSESVFPVLKRLAPDDIKTLKFKVETIDLVRSAEDKSKSNTKSKRSQLQCSLSQCLGLQWRMNDGKLVRNGELDISRYPLSQDSRVNLVRPSLKWDIFVDDNVVTESCHCETAVGEACPISIEITNVSASEIPNVEFELEIFQDQNNGFREWNMEDNVLCVGCQSQSFNNIRPGESVTFRCDVIFLLSGLYRLRLHRVTFHDDAGMQELFSGELVRTLSNQPNMELFSYREFSPHIVIEADIS